MTPHFLIGSSKDILKIVKVIQSELHYNEGFTLYIILLYFSG